MPLARIITRSPQDTIAVSGYLLSLGYTVETISPGEFRVTPAELELDLDQCRPGEVMQRAKALLETHVASAATGTAKSEPQPEQPPRPKIAVAYDIAGRPVEFSEEGLPERRSGPSGLGRALVSRLQRAARGMGRSVAHTRDALGTRIRQFQQRRAEERALALEAELTREREEMLQEEERARERVQREMEAQRLEAEQAELRRQQRMAAEKAAADARERARIEAERAAAMAAAAQRELEKQRLEPPPMAPPTAQQAPAEPAMPEPKMILAPRVEPAANLAKPVLASATVNRAQLRRTIQRGQPLRRRPPVRILRVELATAAAAALILGLGIFGYSVRRPASPLSPGELMKDSSVKQQVPFGAATVAPPAVTPKPSPVTAAPAGRSSAPSHAPAKAAPKRTTARRLRRAAEDDPVAEDEVVVRHLPAQRPK